MIVPDVNLLLCAELDAFPEHALARRWREGLLNGQRQVGIASASLFGFIRISTNRRVFTEPLPVPEAIARVERWLARPSVTYLVPRTRHLEIAFRLLRQLGTAANLTTDVQLAAHAIEHGGEVHSNDVDFARFQGLRLGRSTSTLRPCSRDPGQPAASRRSVRTTAQLRTPMSVFVLAESRTRARSGPRSADARRRIGKVRHLFGASFAQTADAW